VAARKGSFQGNAALYRMRTGNSTNQMAGLLRSFERDATPALVKGRAILDKQRVEMKNRPIPSSTKYVVDTCVFNWLADSLIEMKLFPSDGGFAITHIQVDEINKTKNEERRARLALTQASLHCMLLPTKSLVADVSRVGYANVGDGKLFASLKAELDALNNNKENNIRDALIAEVAIANGYTLLTADEDLRAATEKHAGKVIFFDPPNN